MDEIARYNIERWNALVKANALFTRPALDLDAESSRRADPDGMFGDVNGKYVLLLAGGGGQQSAAFALLGARVTVFDLSAAQLEGDKQSAAQYGVEICTIQGDMRDLSALEAASFDIVYHAYSLNFVPDARAVFAQVARVIRPHGIYHFGCANPFASGLNEHSWNGDGYVLKHAYVQGAKTIYTDSDWVYDRSQLTDGQLIQGPQEFRQTLETLMNGLIEHQFILLRLKEVMATSVSIDAKPGTWDHFTAVIPPWLHFWAIFRPDIFLKTHKG